MRIVWTPGADQDVTGVWEYIAIDNLATADRQIECIVSAVMKLRKFPGMGRPGRCTGTREVVVSKTPYIVMYRVQGQAVEILRILHGNRKWPNIL